MKLGISKTNKLSNSGRTMWVGKLRIPTKKSKDVTPVLKVKTDLLCMSPFDALECIEVKEIREALRVGRLWKKKLRTKKVAEEME